MSKPCSLDQVVSVKSRFTRAMSLVRDFASADALEGYILTPVGRDVLHRVFSALCDSSSTRAWSLTGPYGTGKSSFALFTAQMFAGDPEIRNRARTLLRTQDRALSDKLTARESPLSKDTSRFCPILVSGSRQPLEKALADALAKALRRLSPGGRPPKVVEKLEAIAAAKEPTGIAVVGLYEEANDYLRRFGDDANGLLLVIDELGKFLEYGASHPEGGDVFVLQELAEAASRSTRPFFVLTILHQALDRYAEHMSPSRRSEWAKVHGRFEDVAFEEPAEQMLRLTAQAIRQDGPQKTLEPIRRAASRMAEQCVAVVPRVGSLDRSDLIECLAASYPLHPLTALTVGPLFRQLAQNERSLFAFLSSTEPYGFQEFLRSQGLGEGEVPVYRLDRLYDYVVTALGSSLFVHHRGKVWAEVEAALERLRDGDDLQLCLAKTIGLLQAVGPAGALTPSRKVLHLCLAGQADMGEVDAALDQLTKRSVAIFRRHLGSFALWEGSDIDLEARLGEARREVDRDFPIATFLMQTLPPEARIARRHYFQKGTLRYFETVYADRDSFRRELLRGLGSADGRIVFCLPKNADDREAMVAELKSKDSPAAAGIIAAIPEDLLDLQEYCHELLCLSWVLQHTSELETDRIAHRELYSRMSFAENGLRQHLDWIFAPTGTRQSRCSWYHRGREETLATARAVNDLLSRICDEVFPATPTWRNELINRRSLSSAAAAARRNLIQAMIEHGTEDTLGITGYPPEFSMYETLLRGSRLHRKKAGEWGFFAPDAKSEPAVAEIWRAFEQFLADSEPRRLSVDQLFSVLRKPPFGLKDGILPILTAVMLLHFDTEVALYEDGSFVPRLSDSVFERMFKTPERFELQRLRIAGPRFEVFRKYAEVLNRTLGHTAPDLIALVKPLVRLVRELPEYVGKTRQISPTAQALLRAIREARQPDKLLFVEIPSACGFAPFEVEGKLARTEVDRFFGVLRTGLAELQHAYQQLLDTLKKLLIDALDQKGKLVDARRAIDHEARLVLNLAVDAKLKSFLMRAVDPDTDDATWVESIATLLANRPPTAWDDHDLARFEVELAAIARSFRHFKVLAFEMERSGVSILDGDPGMLRVSVTTPTAGECERVVHVPAEYRLRADRVKDELLKVLAREKLLEKKDVSVALLGQLVRQLLQE
jgi:hypothetical protein